jgi:NADPH:quinone reductase-like Zn-dependent oxidoreductase
VGLAAIQITKLIGATAVATTRGQSKKQALLEAGADHVIVTDEENLSQRTMALTGGKGAGIIFDPIAGPFLEPLAQAAARGAKIFEYGALSTSATPYPLFDALAKGLTIRGYTLFEIVSDPDMLARGKQFIYDGLAAGSLKPIVARTFPLEDIAEAHRFMESNQQIGKIVVTV